MYIPSCPQSLVSDIFKRDVTSTAKSFKSWDTCMDNKTCKIVAIVGICLAALVVISIISTLIRCCCLGLSCVEAICCCCSRGPRRRSVEPRQMNDPYYNTNMYPRSQPMSQAQPAYHPVSSYDNKESPYNTHTGYRAT